MLYKGLWFCTARLFCVLGVRKNQGGVDTCSTAIWVHLFALSASTNPPHNLTPAVITFEHIAEEDPDVRLVAFSNFHHPVILASTAAKKNAL